MKTKKRIALFLVITILISVFSVGFPFNVSAETKKGIVKADVLNIRPEPKTGGTKVGTVLSGETVVINKESKGETIKDEDKSSDVWYNITYNEIKGWVSSLYIELIPEYTYSKDFEKQILAFPSSYRPYLRELHAQYPHWIFVAEKTNTNFAEAVASQDGGMRKQVQLSYHPISWRSMGKGSYDWTDNKWVSTNDGWTGASREIIKYYMDPRNFLNSGDIYMFLQQSYGNGTYTDAGLKKIVTGTFLNTASYRKIILDAGKQSGVSPYIIASKIIQEQGSKGTSDLISGKYKGYENLYNFFNYGASGKDDEVVVNGLKYAKKQGWTTKAKAITGGAKLYARNYIGVGQDTFYFQDFNVMNPDKLSHQYAQAVHDAYSKGSTLRKTYSEMKEAELTFRIPIFNSMPAKATPMPEKSDKRNNYYLTKLSVKGLTPSFNRETYKYDLQITGETIIDATYPKTAVLVANTEIKLEKGDNKVELNVRSETGYLNTYTISVNATKECMLYINTSGKVIAPGDDITDLESNDSSTETKVKLGDTNGDGKITAADMASIRLHLLKKYTLKNDAFTAADINKDGNLTAADMATVRLHLLKKYIIK